MNRARYYKFVKAAPTNGKYEYSIIDEIMGYLTFSRRWDLYPFRINKNEEGLSEREEIIKEVKASYLEYVIRILLTIGVISIVIIGDGGDFQIYAFFALLGYIVYQLILFLLSKTFPRIAAALILEEYPFLWISTWLHIATSISILLCVVTLIGSTLFTLFMFISFQAGFMSTLFNLFLGVVASIVFLAIATIIQEYIVIFFEKEDGSREYVYIEEPRTMIATRRKTFR